MEEKSIRRYTVSNALEETSDYTTQENEQQLYKFTTEYNPSENLQTEYNLLYKTSNQNEISNLTTISGRQGQRVPELIGQYRQQMPYSLNQELRMYYTYNESQIFSIELQHLTQKKILFIGPSNNFNHLVEL